MRKFAAILLLILDAAFITAQISVTNGSGYVNLRDAEKYNLDALILLNGISTSTEITYKGDDFREWVYTLDGSEFNSTQKSIIPEDGVLYTVLTNGDKKYYIYTIDYSVYLADISGLEIIENDESKCKAAQLKTIGSIPALVYKDKNGIDHELERTFKLSYNNCVWKDSVWQDIDELREYQLTDGASIVVDPVPMKSTTFTLEGDNWAEQLNITPCSVSADYTGVAINCHPKGTVLEREYTNELDRISGSDLTGSGPLTVEFKANANPLDFVFYEWIIYNESDKNNYQRYNDTDLRYKFENTGEFQVKLTVSSNGGCQHSDSIRVKVLESKLDVPNVFTPNGDGINDEWRVAYKSIIKYSCIVQNRWGRTVFKSDNPGLGWDGNINGRPASEGTYYYVIIAYGSDVYEKDDRKHKKGDQMKYRLSGHINLFR